MNLLDAFYVPAAVVTAPWWARKTRSGWGERFGHIDSLPAKHPGRPRVLLHAVSVGEVGTLRGLVPLLRERGCEVVVSASTDTGLKRAVELFADQHSTFVVRFALDFSPAVRRFLDAVQPDVAALVELEVWPNFIRDCNRRGIPIGVINGRLSARSFRGYHRFVKFFRPVFGSLAFAGVQDADYAERFGAMGVPPDRLHISGSMKWDALALGTPTLRVGSDARDASNLENATRSVAVPQTLPGADQLARELGIDRTKPLIVAGSTAPIEGVPAEFDCEEALLNAACPEGVQLLCAPRKPEHFDKAFAALGGPSKCNRRSHFRGTGVPPLGCSRFLLDTIGELRAAYSLADIAVIGRTFGTGRGGGGSDPIEPIALGKATILGPHSANFQSIVKIFRDADAAVIAQAADLPRILRELLASPARRTQLATNGAACIREHQGATRRHAEMILAALSARK